MAISHRLADDRTESLSLPINGIKFAPWAIAHVKAVVIFVVTTLNTGRRSILSLLGDIPIVEIQEQPTSEPADRKQHYENNAKH